MSGAIDPAPPSSPEGLDPEHVIRYTFGMTDPTPRKARVRGTHSTTHVEPERLTAPGALDRALWPSEEPTRPDCPHPSVSPPQPRVEAFTDERPTVHVIGLHHTVPSEAFSHCAFTGKVLRFPLVLHEAGYRVVEYANGASQSEADEKVCIWSVDQLSKFAGGDENLFNKTTSGLDSDEELRDLFGLMVTRELRKRVKPGDIVAHVFGCTAGAQRIVKAFPDAIHVETGIGYGSGPFGAYRIFESESWRAWHMGRYTLASNGGGGTWPNYPELTTCQVVPNYYNEKDWALGQGGGEDELADNEPGRISYGRPYVLWVGRLASIKGPEVVQELARANPNLQFKCVSGDELTDAFKQHRLNAPNIEFLGRVSARSDLAKLYGGAVATVMPSLFWEPFGGVAVESLMCGTPVLCPDYAAFVETVADAEDGVRCGPPSDYLAGLKAILDPTFASPTARAQRRARAIERFGVKAVGLRYKAALGAIRRWHAQGLRPEGA